MLLAGGAFATTTAACPDNAQTTRTIYLGTSTDTSPPGVVDCYAYGNGNLTGNYDSTATGNALNHNDPILAGQTQGHNTFNLGADYSTAYTNLVLLDKSDAGGLLSGILTGDVGPSGPYRGSITVGATGLSSYDNLILALKFGNSADPTWGAFAINGPGTYNFLVNPRQGGGISHVMLYGTVATVPVPATGLLLLGGLGALGAMRRRRKAS